MHVLDVVEVLTYDTFFFYSGFQLPLLTKLGRWSTTAGHGPRSKALAGSEQMKFMERKKLRSFFIKALITAAPRLKKWTAPVNLLSRKRSVKNHPWKSMLAVPFFRIGRHFPPFPTTVRMRMALSLTRSSPICQEMLQDLVGLLRKRPAHWVAQMALWASSYWPIFFGVWVWDVKKARDSIHISEAYLPLVCPNDFTFADSSTIRGSFGSQVG